MKHTCVNCNKPVQTQYCASCGQKREVPRINWSSLWENTYKFFGFDTRILRTFGDMTIRPAQVAKTYIGGNRVRYMEPVSFYLLSTTVLYLVLSLAGIEIRDYVEATSNQFWARDSMSARQTEFSRDVLATVTDNFRIFSAFLIPLYAVGTWVVFKKQPFNFLEHLVVNLYAAGWLAIPSLCFQVFFAAIGSVPPFPNTLIALIFYGLLYAGLFEGRRWKLFFRGLLGYILGFVIVVAFLVVAVSVYLIF